MPWFKVDDSFESHPKVKGIPRNKRGRAIGLWTLAGSWSARQLTDGFVPTYMLDELACTVADARALVASGLWIECDGGFRFKDWHDWQPTREKVEQERTAARERMRVARERKKGVGSADVRTNTSEQNPKFGERSGEVRSTHSSVTPTRPDPTRPDQETTTTSASADAEREFEDWYADYPRKRGKGQALKAYKAARKKVGADELVTALRRQIPALTSRGPEYVPYPATWLNGERWADEPDNVRPLRPPVDEQGRIILPPLPNPNEWSGR